MGYKYFDTPDGEDCDKKLLYLVKKAGVTGLYLSSAYVVAVEKPPTYGLIISRFSRITLPLIAAAVAGSVGVCTLVDFRKKDDQLNHLYGGFLAGLAGGVAKGHLGHGITAGVFLGIMAFVYKDSKMRNFDLNIMDFKYNTEDFWTKDYDYRMCKPRPTGWIAK